MRDACKRILACCIAVTSVGTAAASDEDLLSGSSLDDLLNMTVSTAAKHEQTAREAPASVTVVTAEDIQLRGYRTLAEILDDVPGFYISFDRNYAYIGVRGFSRPTDYNNRLLLLLNGTAINEAIWGSAPIGGELGVNMDAVERIEIVRGPGSALYGTSAMFAVVNIITKSGNAVDGIDAVAELGSFGTKRGSVTYGREYGTGLDLSVSGQWHKRDGEDIYFAEYDDPATNDGIAENLDWEEIYGLMARARYGAFSVQGIYVARDKGIPTGAYEVDFNDSRSQSADEYNMIEASYEHALNPQSQLTARVSHHANRYEGDWPYENEVWPDDSDTRSLRTDLQLRYDLRAYNRLTTGVAYENHYRADYWLVDPDGARYFDGTLPHRVASAYLQDEHQFSRDLAATVGVRVSHFSTVGTVTSPRGALVYHGGPSTTLKLLYGEAFRAPGMYEIEYADELSGIKANRDLDSETIRTVELIWDQRLSPAIVAVTSLYHSTVDDLVDQVEDPSDGLIQHRNVQKVTSNGLELGLKGRFDAGLSADASYTFQRARDEASDTTLSNAPCHMLKVGMGLPLRGYGRLAPRARYESSRRTAKDANIRTGSRLLVDLRYVLDSPLSLGASTSSGNQTGLSVSLSVKNLLDTDYATPGGLEHEQPGIAQDGRSATLRIEYHL